MDSKVTVIDKKQRDVLKRAFRMIERGLQECDQLTEQATEDANAAQLLVLRVSQITKLMRDVDQAFAQSIAAAMLVDKIEAVRTPKKTRAKRVAKPTLRLVKGGGA
jgi:vacuolar-type H+-ATPase subunit D/Vma8